MSINKELANFENDVDFMAKYNATEYDFGASPEITRAEKNHLVKLCQNVDDYITMLKKLYSYRSFSKYNGESKGEYFFDDSVDINTAKTLRKLLEDVNNAVNVSLFNEDAFERETTEIIDYDGYLRPCPKCGNKTEIIKIVNDVHGTNYSVRCSKECQFDKADLHKTGLYGNIDSAVNDWNS